MSSLVLLNSSVLYAREIPVVTVSGADYQRGLAHGRQLREPIGRLITDVKVAIREKYKRHPDEFISEFVFHSDLLSEARRWMNTRLGMRGCTCIGCSP